jgi:hypothetical protein
MRALSEKQVQELSSSLLGDLAEVTNSPEDNFTLELVQTQFFLKGQTTSGDPFIEILWFPRPQGIQDQVASMITERVQKLTKAAYVTVVFTELTKTHYYENGNHF